MNRKFITVPQYYSKFIDKNVNLESNPKQCCPFHKENTPSFSFNPNTGKWRCFGSCKTGGDVIDLHRMNYKLNSRKEAERSLSNLLGIPYKEVKSIEDIKNQDEVFLNEEDIELDSIYRKLLIHANCPERWIQLDYVMSIYPVDIIRLKDLAEEWRC